MKIRSLYVFCPPLLNNTQFHRDAYSAFFDSFKTPRVFSIRGSYSHSGEKIRVVGKPCSSQFKKKYLEEPPLLQFANYVLEFSGCYKFPGSEKYLVTDPTGKIVPHSERELRSLWQQLLPDDLDVCIQSYLCALMLAFPGAIRPAKNI